MKNPLACLFTERFCEHLRGQSGAGNYLNVPFYGAPYAHFAPFIP